MSDTAHTVRQPSVKLAARYVFTDDAIADAMQLVTALTQLGQADRVRESLGGVMRAKRALATDKWTRTAETEFWASFARLSQAARECGVLHGPVTEHVQASGFLPWLRKVATFPGAIVVLLSFVLMAGWLWGKTLAETIEGERASLRYCLQTGAPEYDPAINPAAAAAPHEPDKGLSTALSEPSRIASCDHILASLEDKLDRAQAVAEKLYWMPVGPQATRPECDAAAGSGGPIGGKATCLILFAYNAPAADALGKIVQAFAIFVLPPLLGALGAWSYCMRQMIRSSSIDTSRSRLSDRRHWLNMLFGAMLGSAFALWTADKTGVPQMFASLPPLIAAFLAGYGRDFIFAWMDELLNRARGQRPEAPPAPADPAERPDPVPAEPRLKPASRVVGAN